MPRKLEKLTQDEDGVLHGSNGEKCFPVPPIPIGPLTTLLVQNLISVDSAIETSVKEKSGTVPVDANAYLASDFNRDTQFIRNKKMFSVYAVQFYHI